VHPRRQIGRGGPDNDGIRLGQCRTGFVLCLVEPANRRMARRG
jgi:hypothetical protein